MKNSLLLFVSALVLSVGTTYGATAAKGVFTVAEGKTVQFASGVETGLYKWADAVALTSAAGSEWTMLRGAEWSYLLASGRTDAADKNALGKVDGKKGLIILPDEWTQPDGAPVFKKVTETGISYEYNDYSTAEWSLMETAGAVFLPCGGYGYDDGEGHHTENTDDHGAYWALDEYTDATQANCMRFNTDGSGSIHDFNHQVKTAYYSVILVREVVILDENDEQSDFNTKIEQARGKDIAFVRRTLWKDGYFNTLCLPFDVDNIADSPLAGAEAYTFGGAEIQNNVMQLDLVPVTNNKLEQGVPYFIRWANTNEKMTFLRFDGVTTWDGDKVAGEDPGSSVKYHGFYYKSHIGDIKEETTTEGIYTHYNFFLWDNDEIHWPSDGDDPAAKMKGFRAHFYIDGKGGQSQGDEDTPVAGMPARLRIRPVLGGATGMNNGEWLMVNGECQKIMRNGQIYLLHEGQMYDAQGRRIQL